MLTGDLRRELAEKEDLPSLPAAALEILRLTRAEETDLAEFATALSRDPALVARLLKHANSVKAGARHEITTVRHAIMMIGLNTARDVCLGFSLAENLRRHRSRSGLDLTEFWRRSLVSAVSGRALALRVGERSGDEAFLCGLLIHFGKLVLDRHLPEPYAEVIAKGTRWPSLQDEERILGYDSAEVGAAVLAQWGLPEFVPRTLAVVHRPDERAQMKEDAHRSFAELMHLNCLFEGLLCDEDPEASTLQAYGSARHFGLNARDVEYFLTGLSPAIRDVSKILSIEIPRELPGEEILERARRAVPDEPIASCGPSAKARRAVKVGEEEPVPSYEDERDASTGLPNRTACDDFIERLVRLRLHNARPGCLGLILVRCDSLGDRPDPRDRESHETILRHAAQSLAAQTRKTDLWARFGDSTIALVLTNTVPIGVKVLTERLRTAIANEAVNFGGVPVPLTASFGAAWLSSVESEGDALLLVQHAERLLWKARRTGGNRCERGGVERR